MKNILFIIISILNIKRNNNYFSIEDIIIIKSILLNFGTYFTYQKSGLDFHIMNDPEKAETLVCFLI